MDEMFFNPVTNWLFDHALELTGIVSVLVFLAISVIEEDFSIGNFAMALTAGVFVAVVFVAVLIIVSMLWKLSVAILIAGAVYGLIALVRMYIQKEL